MRKDRALCAPCGAHALGLLQPGLMLEQPVKLAYHSCLNPDPLQPTCCLQTSYLTELHFIVLL